MGHAKAILSLEKKAEQMQLAIEIIAKKMSVRQAEKAAQEMKKGRAEKKPLAAAHAPEVATVEDRLRRALGTKVRLIPQGKGGEIRVSYYSLDDLERILETLS